jgi:hypothetical protein
VSCEIWVLATSHALLTILVHDPACAPAMGSMALVENPGLHPTKQAVSERLASPDGAVLTGAFPVACGGGPWTIPVAWRLADGHSYIFCCLNC